MATSVYVTSSFRLKITLPDFTFNVPNTRLSCYRSSPADAYNCPVCNKASTFPAGCSSVNFGCGVCTRRHRAVRFTNSNSSGHSTPALLYPFGCTPSKCQFSPRSWLFQCEHTHCAAAVSLNFARHSAVLKRPNTLRVTAHAPMVPAPSLHGLFVPIPC